MRVTRNSVYLINLGMIEELRIFRYVSTNDLFF